MKAAIYTRISTADQNAELQLREIRDYADRQRWEIVDTYDGIISESLGLKIQTLDAG